MCLIFNPFTAANVMKHNSIACGWLALRVMKKIVCSAAWLALRATDSTALTAVKVIKAPRGEIDKRGKTSSYLWGVSVTLVTKHVDCHLIADEGTKLFS